MMNSCIRIRVQLDITPIPFPKQCWLLIDSGACRVVGDIAHLISEKFGINGTSGLQLYLDNFLLPMNEDAAIVRDNDRIQARVQKSSILALTSVGNPPLFTAVEFDGASEPHRDKKNRKRKRKDSATSCHVSRWSGATEEGAVSPVEHGSSFSGQSVDINEAPTTEELPSDTKRKRKSRPSKSSVTSTAVLRVPAEDSWTAIAPEDTEGGNLNDLAQAVPPPLAKKKKETELHAVATKTTIGSLHVRFHSGSSGSEPDEEPPISAKKSKTARGKGIAKEPEADGPTEVSSKNPCNVSRPGKEGTLTKELGTQKEANELPRKPKQRKPRRKKLTPDTIVGGNDDIFTTRTNVYISSDQGASEMQSGAEGACSSSHDDKQQGAVEDFAEPVLKLDQQPASTGGVSETLPVVKRSYDALPDLRGPPRVGDRIAFKLLELSVNCTPEVSSYKEGKVISVSLDTVQIELSKESTQQHEEISEESALAKFQLPDSDQSEDDEANPRKPSEVESVIELPLNALLQPKLL